MNLAIEGGDGVCGINVLPGIMPVFKGTDACYSGSFGRGLGNPGFNPPGAMNPCGEGTCQLSGTSNTCVGCPRGFVEAVNSDLSRTCVPVNPCAFFLYNPCGFGACIRSTSPGLYTCLCPAGYVVSTLAAGSTRRTCTFDYSKATPFPQKYTVPSDATGVTCTAVAVLFGLSLAEVAASNPRLNCPASAALAGGTKVIIPKNITCNLPYIANEGDTCAYLTKIFKLRSVATLQSANPTLNCGAGTTPITAGRVLCVRLGSPPEDPLCTGYHTVLPGETCESLITIYFQGSAASFFNYNPGLNCKLLILNIAKSGPASKFGQQICLGAVTEGAIIGECASPRKTFVVPSGLTCQTLLGLHFGHSMKTFKAQNKQRQCRDAQLHKGSRVCYKP
eukprot:TRINITY_DN1654_c0_g1_i6.p1 TRINITY_DN1654_c0_g1~~TRINITY_DN1654_c0_g1_i6.p1  ORF type:complete len:391 (+),score=20.86 TRINITY_DN1654_c0_g1_i6:139-1311(+)